MRAGKLLQTGVALAMVGIGARASAEPSADGASALSAARSTTDDAWASQVRAARASADGVLNEMVASSHRLSQMLRGARARGDDARARCAGEGLSRVDVAVKRAQRDLNEAFGAYARRDGDGARRAMTRFVSDREASRVASSDVEACFSMDRTTNDRTQVRVTIDPQIVAIDR